MSKKQQNLHKKSLIQADWYENLSSEKKKGYTKANIVSCERVDKEGNYNVYQVEMDLLKKGLDIDSLRLHIYVSQRGREVIGIKTRGKIAFLLKYHNYSITGL